MTRSVMELFLPEGVDRLEGLSFEFGVGLPLIVGIILVVVTASGAGLYALRGMAGGRRSVRMMLSVIRAAVIALALFLALDPLIVGFRVRPSGQTVAILFDDSRSMGIRHDEAGTRGELFRDAYTTHAEAFDAELRRRFHVAYFGLAEMAYRVSGPESLTEEGQETRIARSIFDVVHQYDPDSLAGIVLFTDGVEQGSDKKDPDAFQELDVPVFVALPPQAPWRDLEIGNVDVPDVPYVDVPVSLDVPIRSSGQAGDTARVELLKAVKAGEGVESRVIASREFNIKGDSHDRIERFEFTPDEEGWAELEVRVSLEGAGEAKGGETAPDTLMRDQVPQNDTYRFLLDLRPRIYRIFYFSGRPNWENTFIRRALASEKQLAVTTHVRISEAEKEFVFRGSRSSVSNRLFEGFDPDDVDQPRYDEAVFLRFGRDAEPLSDGYPTRLEDLFSYDLVVWSDIEYDFFNPRQIEQTREFVRKRGGRFLLVGGPESNANSGFSGSLIEGLFPVLLSRAGTLPGAVGETRGPGNWAVRPTLDGEVAGLFMLSPESVENTRLWASMPPLSGVSRVAATRPGATVLALAQRDEQRRPLFIQHRFGEGRVSMLVTGTTWLWKMGKNAEDRNHQTVWRQILRDLAHGAPDPIRLLGKQEIYSAEKQHILEFLIRDERFDTREAAQLTLEIRSSQGDANVLAVEESVDQPGRYRAVWSPDSPGSFDLKLVARTEYDERIGEFEDRLKVAEDRREFSEARPDRSYLQRIARESGGASVELDELASLAERIPWRPPDRQEALRFHLWHLPFFYVLLVLLLCCEWFFRRRSGFA